MEERAPLNKEHEFPGNHHSNPGNPGMVDRISNLPDPILHEILSLMPFRDAVGTSTLAKRWRCLWLGMPDMDFDQHVIHYHISSTSSRGIALRNTHEAYLKQHGWATHLALLPTGSCSLGCDCLPGQDYLLNYARYFMDFVDRALHFRNDNGLNIRRLSLCFSTMDCPVPRLRSWIMFAAEGNVEELHVSIHYDRCSRIPALHNSFSACDSLRVLKLRHSSLFYLPVFSSLETLYLEDIYFVTRHDGFPSTTSDDRLEAFKLEGYEVYDFAFHPRLKKMTLESCHWPCNCTLNIGCPTLEELNLMRNYRLTDININAKGLKRLCIEDWHGYSFKISEAPTLRSFRWLESSAVHLSFPVADLIPVTEAVIQLSNIHRAQSALPTGGSGVMKLLHAVAQTHDLELNERCLEVPSCKEDPTVQLPTFCNVRRLKLSVPDKNGCIYLIPRLLQACPVLEALVIRFVEKQEENRPWRLYNMDDDPQEVSLDCLSHHLNIVEVMDFTGQQQELQIVACLLRNAVELEKLILHCPKKQSEDVNFLEDLQVLFNCPTVSPKVVISLI